VVRKRNWLDSKNAKKKKFPNIFESFDVEVLICEVFDVVKSRSSIFLINKHLDDKAIWNTLNIYTKNKMKALRRVEMSPLIRNFWVSARREQMQILERGQTELTSSSRKIHLFQNINFPENEDLFENNKIKVGSLFDPAAKFNFCEEKIHFCDKENISSFYFCSIYSNLQSENLKMCFQ